MKKLLIVLLALAVLAVPAIAQESYEINVNANQVVKVDRARSLHNRRGCEGVALPNTCTQADVDALTPAPNSKPTIYPDSEEGRGLFLRSLLIAQFVGLWDAVVAQETQDFCNWFKEDATVAQVNAVCGASGLPNGCDVCRNR